MQQARHQLMALHEDFCVFLQEAGVMKRAFPDQSSLYRRQGLGFHIGCAASHSDRAACAWFWMLHLHAFCPLFPSTSHTVALRHTDVLDIGELSSVSLCIVLFPDTVQTIFPLTDLSDLTGKLQSANCDLWAECTVPLSPVVRQPKACSLGQKYVLPFSGPDSARGEWCRQSPCLVWCGLHLFTCLFGNVKHVIVGGQEHKGQETPVLVWLRCISHWREGTGE